MDNLHPIHKDAYIKMKAMGFSGQALQRYVEKMTILANIPQKEWGKQSTIDKMLEKEKESSII